MQNKKPVSLIVNIILTFIPIILGVILMLFPDLTTGTPEDATTMQSISMIFFNLANFTVLVFVQLGTAIISVIAHIITLVYNLIKQKTNKNVPLMIFNIAAIIIIPIFELITFVLAIL